MDYFMRFVPLITAVSILILTFLAVYLFQKAFNKFVLSSSSIVRNDPTNYKFLKHTVSSVIYVLGFGLAIFQIESLKILAGSMLAGAGLLAVAVGFASQAALSNVISGVFIIIFKPYRVNDRIKVRDTLQGVVEDITLRHTVIRDYENKRIVIPNSVISEEVVINSDLTDERVCRMVEIGVSYDSDVVKAKKIMQEEALAHPLRVDSRTPEQVENGAEELQVRVVSLGDSSVNLRAWVWAGDQAAGFEMHCDLLESLKRRFDEEGVEIPYPHRTVVYKNLPPDVQIDLQKEAENLDL